MSGKKKFLGCNEDCFNCIYDDCLKSYFPRANKPRMRAKKDKEEPIDFGHIHTAELSKSIWNSIYSGTMSRKGGFNW